MASFTLDRLHDPDAFVVAFAGAFDFDVFAEAVRAAYADPSHATLDAIWDCSGLGGRVAIGPDDFARARAELDRARPSDRAGRTVFVVPVPEVALLAHLYRYQHRTSEREYLLVATRAEAIERLREPSRG